MDNIYKKLEKIKLKIQNGESFSKMCRFKNGELEQLIDLTKDFNIFSKLRPVDRVWLYLNNIKIDDVPKCRICKRKPVLIIIGFREVCGGDCGIQYGAKKSKTPEAIKKAEKTKKKVLMEKYGVDHVSKIDFVKNKKKETAIRNYGSLKSAYYDTAQKIIKQKYGVNNISELEETKQKKIKTSKENYGTDYPWQSRKGKEEQNNGVIKKYGTSNVSQVELIKDKKKQTTMKNYGVDNPFKSKLIKEKIVKTNLDKFGCKNASNSDIVKKKKIETSIKNCGKEYWSQTLEGRRRLRIHFIKVLEKRLKNGHQLTPNYNPEACKLIDEYGKLHGYEFQHAENGGEFHVKELGYWVDGYDKKRNIVIEIDESFHFDENGKLKNHDIIRQKEITNFLKCKFTRIKI